MKKNGFTLIELLGAILIVGLISSIVVPAVMKVVRNARESAYEEQITYIENAAEKWAVFNANKVSELRNYYLSTDDLLTEGYIDGEDIKDPRDTNEKITGCIVISYDNSYSQYVYKYTKDECSTLGTNIVETAASCFTTSGATITGYTCTERSITIPKKINGTIITTIGANAFKTKYLNEVVLQEGITTISASAFEDNRIKHIEIPASVKTIGNSAFNKNKLTEIELPNTVTTVGTYAFSNNNIKNVVISSSLTGISNGVFMNNSIGGVKLDSNIKSVGENAFKGNNITNLTLKSGVTTINAGAFEDNSLTYVNLPNSITTIGGNAFAKNKILNVVLPSSLSSFNCSSFIGNGTTKLEFMSANASISNVGACVNSSSNYSVTSVEIPVGTLSFYSGFDSNTGDSKLNSWNLIEN